MGTAGLTAALSRALELESTSEATRAILQGVVGALGADAGRILFLDLKTGTFQQRSQVGHAVHAHVDGIAAAGHSVEGNLPPRDILAVAARSRRPAYWKHDERTAPSSRHEPQALYRAVYPVTRAGTPVALIDIEGRRSPDLDDLRELRDLLFRLLVGLYERRFTLRLLHELQRPIRANRNRREFYDELAALISDASGMEFIAVREYSQEDHRLRCVATDGLGVPRGELHVLDLAPLDDYPSFAQALNGQTTPEPTIASEHLAPIRRNAYLEHVRSFVALPIVVGEEILGVLSVAARCPYAFSRIELRGFEMIANTSGVAMANFKNLHAGTAGIRRLAEVSASALGDLLAQAARHEAKGYLDSAQKRLNLISRTLAGKTTGIKDPPAELLSVSEQLKRTRDSLDKMKTNALIQPDQTPVPVDIRDILIAATDQIFGELDSHDIAVHLPGPGHYVQVIPEATSLAFLHLLQNSILAFAGTKTKKRGRLIEVTIGARQARSDYVKLTFSDNATGIDPARLRIPPDLEDLPWEQALFERGVTSTNEGTGFGLYLVRTLLAKAGGGSSGTIDLIEHRNRVVFEIRLPAAD